jgi:metacaspase-1
MSKGYSLHIGINRVDPQHYYKAHDLALQGAEQDATAWAALAIRQHFVSRQLHSEQATRSAVQQAIIGLAATAAVGDWVLITYAGHGGQLPDANGDETDDQKDETWCCFDGHLLDDEIKHALAHMKAGVRVVLISDSCHSGSISKDDAEEDAAPEQGLRFAPPFYTQQTYTNNQAFYDAIRAQTRRLQTVVAADVLVLSAARDKGQAYEEGGHGLFTRALLGAWNNGVFAGDYQALLNQAFQRLGGRQMPQLSQQGGGRHNLATQRAFTL